MDAIQKKTTSELYGAARRNSRRVKFLRYALPTAACCLLVGFILVTYVRTLLPETVVIESAAIEDGYIIMDSPVLAGQNSNDLPYRMEAERAIQKVGDNSKVTFENIDAQLPLSSGETAQITAQEGLLDQSKNVVMFSKPFEVETTNGIIAQFQDGDFNMSTSDFTTDSDVEIKFDGGTIKAQSMVLGEGGQKMSFKGNVKMRVSAAFANRGG